MPSTLHETIIELFRDRPELAPELLSQRLSQAVPDYDEIGSVDANLPDLVPAEFRVDTLHLLRRAGVAVYCIAVEVQLRRDDRKRFSWPVYGTVARARHGCDACLLVVSPEESVARWARQAIPLGGGSTFMVSVIGPDDLPRPTAEQAREQPHLAMLSTLAHARGPEDAPLVVDVLKTLGETRGSDAMPYHQLVLASLREAVRAAVEELMKLITVENIDPILKPAYLRGREEGRAEALLRVLTTRGLTVTEEQKARVLGCGDSEQLNLWLDQALVARSTEEALADRR